MTQVDLEPLVCASGCGDTKISCEKILTGSDPNPNPSLDPDFPAESYSIPLTDRSILQWLDNNINPVYDRDDSTKGTTNPKSHIQQQQHATNSQRFSGNLKPTAKAPIIALPNKIQHSGYLGQSNRKPHGRIFPQKGVRVLDPGSPKVSCFGKVVSEKERTRRLRDGGGWRGLFMCFRRRKPAEVAVEEARYRNKVVVRERKVEAAPTTGDAPGLGGMKRFASGRQRAMSWGGGDVEVELDGKEDGRVAWSGPLFRR